ncbi:hypothetical protein MASR2M47_22460 [Draconibacterium sp.]
MNSKKFNPHFTGIAAFLITMSLCSCNSPEPSKKEKPVADDYYVAAYIWPSCHHDARFGDMLWPEGIGEWEVIKKGNPRFEGHYQPRLPLWGYEMDNDPKVVERWIDVAVDHGINVFVYDWYWFDGGLFGKCPQRRFFEGKKQLGNAVLYYVGQPRRKTELLELS